MAGGCTSPTPFCDARPFGPILRSVGHVGPDGLKVDPFFNIDLNKFPTGRTGHDMLIN